MTAETPSRHTAPFRFVRFLVVVVVAAVVNALVYGIATAANASMVMTGPPADEIGLGIVIVATLVPLLVAGLVCWFLIRAFPRLGRWLPLAGLVVAVASALAPLTASADVQTRIALAVMHVVAGVAWFVGTRRSSVAG